MKGLGKFSATRKSRAAKVFHRKYILLYRINCFIFTFPEKLRKFFRNFLGLDVIRLNYTKNFHTLKYESKKYKDFF